MFLHRTRFWKVTGLLLAGMVVVTACQMFQPPTNPTAEPSQTASITAVSQTPQPTATVTPTPEPLVARVDGGGVTIARFDAELHRFQTAQPNISADQARQQVLDNLIDETLLAESAVQNGFTVTDEDLQARVDKLTAELGGQEKMDQWLAANSYTADTFKADLSQSIAASWQRDQIAAEVPQEMEQVHARQILVLNQSQADKIYLQLQAGADFATLVVQYDPVTGGDLGWFPKGYLTIPELDEAAYSLQPEQYTQVIKSQFGYHILQVVERKVAPLSPDARQTLQHRALQDWLKQRRSQASIEILSQ